MTAFTVLKQELEVGQSLKHYYRLSLEMYSKFVLPN